MNDPIERDDVIKALRLEYPMMPLFKELQEEWAIKTEGYRKAEKVIMSLPSAKPQGKWIEVTNGRGGHECSECHDYAPSFQSGAEYLSRFCPNCGADMRGGGE